jgi:preprotein translocase subunit SecA
VDEARTPLIISGEEKFGQREEALLSNAMRIASQFEEGLHFRQDDTAAIHMTKAGDALVVEACRDLEGLWKSPFYRDPLVKQAVAALHTYHIPAGSCPGAAGARACNK